MRFYKIRVWRKSDDIRSFLTGNWHSTWVLWPVAGILFGAVANIVKMRKK